MMLNYFYPWKDTVFKVKEVKKALLTLINTLYSYVIFVILDCSVNLISYNYLYKVIL